MDSKKVVCPCDECLLIPSCRTADFPTLLRSCSLLTDYLHLHSGLQTKTCNGTFPSRIVSAHEILNPTTWFLTLKNTRHTKCATVLFLLGLNQFPSFYTSLWGSFKYMEHKNYYITGLIDGAHSLNVKVRIDPRKHEKIKNKIYECLKKKKEKGYRTYGAGNDPTYKRCK
jgi:hypothetical protein